MLCWLAVACGKPVVYENYREIPGESWSRYEVAEFEVDIPDSGRYEIALWLRHTTDYEMANLWCFVSARMRGKEVWRDTVNLKIAESDGRWLGRGGSVKTLGQTAGGSPVVLPAGPAVFRIEQGMRFEEMKGVKNVGIRIEKAGEDEK